MRKYKYDLKNEHASYMRYSSEHYIWIISHTKIFLLTSCPVYPLVVNLCTVLAHFPLPFLVPFISHDNLDWWPHPWPWPWIVCIFHQPSREYPRPLCSQPDLLVPIDCCYPSPFISVTYFKSKWRFMVEYMYRLILHCIITFYFPLQGIWGAHCSVRCRKWL